jgi:hypothetical protein
MTTGPPAQIGSLPAEVIAAAGRGWRLHPLKPHEKLPLIKSWHAKATSETAQLATWATQFPGCNWGATTGPESDLFVMDFDGNTGLDWLKTHIDAGDELPESWAVRTARGLHLYFSWPAGLNLHNSAGKIGPHVDVRAKGGYVAIPPSLHPDGPKYIVVDESCPVSPAPRWMLTLLQDQSRIAITEPPARFGVLYPGKRNDGLTRFAGSLRRKGRTPAEIESELLRANCSRCDPPLPEGEVSKIAASVTRYPVGGLDPLEKAWQAAQADQCPSRYGTFLLMAQCLQVARPGLEVALPLVRIAALAGVHFTSVQQWRKKAVVTGLLVPAGQYIPHRRAGLYRVNETPTREFLAKTLTSRRLSN